MEDELGPLPTMVAVTQAFASRLPSQRVIDMLTKMEPGLDLGELMTQQPSRVMAFRCLLRDYPTRDPNSLWLHAYDVEVDLVEVDPTNGNGQKPTLPFAPTTT